MEGCARYLGSNREITGAEGRARVFRLQMRAVPGVDLSVGS